VQTVVAVIGMVDAITAFNQSLAQIGSGVAIVFD
jgi:hypothetical protein